MSLFDSEERHMFGLPWWFKALGILVLIGTAGFFYYQYVYKPGGQISTYNVGGQEITSIVLKPQYVNTTDTKSFFIQNPNSYVISIDPEFTCTCQFRVNVEIHPQISDNTYGPTSYILNGNQKAVVLAVGTWLSGNLTDGIHVAINGVKQ